ncbi:MAG: glycosyltransferase family 4 protein [Gemmatimonadales bacterium]|nr:glycosyltransferase family 4 protein [Gemmatimonadales bacterium]
MTIPVVTVNVRRLAGVRTGVETYMTHLLNALHATGSARVVATTCEALPPGMIPEVEIRWQPMQQLRSGQLGSQLRKLWFDYWGCLTPVRSQGSILFHGLDGVAPHSLRRSDKCVITVHDLAFAVHPELYDRRTRMLYRTLFPRMLRRANRIIADSAHTAGDLVRIAGVPASRIDVVHLGVDPIYFLPPTAKLDTGPWGEAPYVLAVGGVSPRKNGRRVIDAFTRWRSRGGARLSYRLLITGKSLDPAFAGAGSPDLPDGVSLLGHVDDAMLHALYAGAKVLLFPAIYEGFGLPIVEAMASGTPVVTSRTGSAPEAAGGAAVLVDPFDVEAIASGLELATRPDEQARLRALGPRWAERFTWERTAIQTGEIYRALNT